MARRYGDKTPKLRGFREKQITINEYDACVIRGCLMTRLKEVRADIELFRIAKSRDLTREERYALPYTMREGGLFSLSREEIEEQINPWISLQMVLEEALKDYTFDDLD
tara:strand:- start:193 stop:519 length:327 start_codon:yes stop_codon:yes gene_type:complete